MSALHVLILIYFILNIILAVLTAFIYFNDDEYGLGIGLLTVIAMLLFGVFIFLFSFIKWRDTKKEREKITNYNDLIDRICAVNDISPYTTESEFAQGYRAGYAHAKLEIVNLIKEIKNESR